MASSDTRQVKSRKPHLCLWCGERIEKGEEYSLTEWAENEQHGRERFHLECWAAMGRSLTKYANYDDSEIEWWRENNCIPKFARGQIHEAEHKEELCVSK